MAMAKSAPHVYVSALPFAPMNSLVSVKYFKLFPHTLHVEHGQLSHWSSSETVIQVGSAVLSIALSSDGQNIISGLDNGTICVWNATTGEMVKGPFTGHIDSVRSVDISPDGQWVVSGSDDQTICVWNAITGELATSPFTGHIGPVNSVAFSPDGQLIVSGSSDKTIYVWNSMTGVAVAGPFRGHTGQVTSVAFSPNSQQIVSGSFDKTICMWNAMTGEALAGPFTGHSHSVTSVGFSPDGQQIVSGSNVLSEQPHTYPIREVDGKRARAVCRTGPQMWPRATYIKRALVAYIYASERGHVPMCYHMSHMWYISIYELDTK